MAVGLLSSRKLVRRTVLGGGEATLRGSDMKVANRTSIAVFQFIYYWLMTEMYLLVGHEFSVTCSEHDGRSVDQCRESQCF